MKSESTDNRPPWSWRTGDTFILDLARRSLDRAYALTPFGIAERLLFAGAPASYFVVDAWVIAHFVFAITLWLAVSSGVAAVLKGIFIAYLAWRVFEICLYNLRVMLGAHSKIPTPNVVRSKRRSLLLGLLNYAEVLFWFAAAYHVMSSHFGTNASFVDTVTGSIYFSVLTMATYGDITPKSTVSQWLVMAHLAVSLYLTLGVLARFVSLLPNPESLEDEESNKTRV
jgi:hypothetical protein